MSTHIAVKDKVILLSRNGEQRVRARCTDATKAAQLLNHAASLNDQRKYTASSRMSYLAEALPGFTWLE